MLLDHFFEHVPYLGTFALNHFFCAFNGRGITLLFEFIKDKGFEQLKRHLLRQTTLVQFEIRTNHDHGPAGIINTFSKQVLPETSLLAFQHIRKRFERTLVRPAKNPSPPSVVKESINRFLKHSFLVANNNGWGFELFKPVKPVLVDDPPVNHSSRGSKPAAFEGTRT
jgi:hypothetical protein